jgi:hypothetical protein
MTQYQKSFILCGAGLTLTPCPAFAHAAEQGFVLLLPTTAYITAGTLAVAATMLLLVFLKEGKLITVFSPADTGLSAHRVWPPRFVPFAASIVLALLIFVGLNGPNDPQANLLPLVLWTVWWMSLFVVQGLLFDIWRWVNPWVGLHVVIHPGGNGIFLMPKRLSVWPAVILFLAFQGYVLVDVAPNDPVRLARFALGYWAFTLAGMSVFGRDPWLRQVECFSVLFNLLGTLRVGRADDTVKIGLPGWQALANPRFDLSHAMFVIIILAAGSFDGLHETFWWLGKLGVNPLEFPGRSAMVWKTTLGLYGAILLLTLVFAFAVWIGLKASRAQIGFRWAFIRFSITLLPIAIGYHFAHFFVTFLVQIQFVAATLADPLAMGWNLFGLGSTRVKVGFLTVPDTVRMIWLTQAGIVVLSHVLSVLMCHHTAETAGLERGGVLRLQIGLAILMVAYTIFGLWLLASPRGV